MLRPGVDEIADAATVAALGIEAVEECDCSGILTFRIAPGERRAVGPARKILSYNSSNDGNVARRQFDCRPKGAAVLSGTINGPK